MPKQSHVLFQAMWELPTYIRHCEVSKRGLAEELAQLEREMDKELGDLDEFEQDAFFRDVNDHWIETAETLPRLQWYAQLLVAYGHFEKTLNDFCLEQRGARGASLFLKDLHGQGISRAKNYLVKVIGITKAFSTPEWQAINAICLLRNSIAHRDGFVDFEPEKPQSTYSQLVKIEGIELRQEVINQEDAQIVFNEQVVINALKQFDTFIRILAEETANG